MTDVLTAALIEVERHVGRAGWDQPARLFALVPTAEFILAETRNCHGFYGASSMERLPVETALTEQTRRFKRISTHHAAGAGRSAADGRAREE